MCLFSQKILKRLQIASDPCFYLSGILPLGCIQVIFCGEHGTGMSGKNIYNGCSPEICKMLWFSFPAAINRYMRTKVCMMLFYLIILC